MNEILISAHSLRRAALHHVLAVVTLYISMMLLETHYDKVYHSISLVITLFTSNITGNATTAAVYRRLQ